MTNTVEVREEDLLAIERHFKAGIALLGLLAHDAVGGLTGSYGGDCCTRLRAYVNGMEAALGKAYKEPREVHLISILANAAGASYQERKVFDGILSELGIEAGTDPRQAFNYVEASIDRAVAYAKGNNVKETAPDA